MNPEEVPITALVEGLASSDASAREAAAREFYRRGRAMADAAVAHWRNDRELAALISGQITVGVAVTREHFVEIRSALGNPRLSNVPSEQDAEEFDLSLSGGVHLDILTTKNPGGAGAIARYLEKFGEGIQQVESPVKNVDRATEILRSRFGIAPVYAATQPGADGTRVNFFLASAPNGRKVLIELVEASQ